MLTCLVLRRCGLGRPVALAGAAALACALAFVPVGPVPLGGYALGIVGDPSLSSLSLLALVLAGAVRGRLPAAAGDWRLLPLFAAAAGLLLYPAAFGAVAWDAYPAGYHPRILAPTAGAVAILCWFGGARWSAVTIAAALAAFQLHLLASDNLWDYLLDPLLALTGAGLWLVRRVRRAR